jgi:hypothetical protein
MERAVAIKKLTKLLGKSLGYRVNDKAPTHEEREEAKQKLPALAEERKRAQEAVRLRRDVILDRDRELQGLIAIYQQVNKEWERTAGMTHYYKFTVGTSNGMFFHIRAQGDSWEEVISKIEEGRMT